MYRGFGIIVSALLTRRRGEFSTRFPPRGGLAEAIRYALARWPALCRFLDDGRIELDTNAVERAIRPVALGQKTICSPDLRAARIDGPSSPRFSPRQSSTGSSPTPTSKTCSSA